MNPRGYFIAGTDTGVGKTRVTVGLLGTFRAQGIRALGMKAVASGTDADGVNEDVAHIHAANAAALTLPRAPAPAGTAIRTALSAAVRAAENPYCFKWPVSPHLAARRAGVTIDPAHISAAAQVLADAGGAEMLLVEGTGGWLAPIDAEERTMADIAAALGLPVVLVVGLRLGCLSHALLTVRAITASRLPLAGWIGSQAQADMLALDENIATLDARLPAPRLGLLPYSPGALEDASHLSHAALALCR